MEMHTTMSHSHSARDQDHDFIHVRQAPCYTSPAPNHRVCKECHRFPCRALYPHSVKKPSVLRFEGYGHVSCGVGVKKSSVARAPQQCSLLSTARDAPTRPSVEAISQGKRMQDILQAPLSLNLVPWKLVFPPSSLSSQTS